jgi:hypothetical protein
MRTTLETTVTRESTIPHMHAQAHDLPGFPGVMCIDIINKGNRHVPSNLQHAMLVPNGVDAPKLGSDRTVYPVPADYDKVDILISIGIFNDSDHVAMQMNISMSDGTTMVHNHVACPFL